MKTDHQMWPEPVGYVEPVYSETILRRNSPRRKRDGFEEKTSVPEATVESSQSC